MRRFFKRLLVGFAVLLGALILWVIATLVFPPEYKKAVTKLPGTDAQLTMILKPTHLFLAEYDRTLILGDSNKDNIQHGFLSDTGGYSRAQLYVLPNGEFILKSYFDEIAIISTKRRRINSQAGALPAEAKYLGAFADDSSHVWRFMSSEESPEQSLIAGGG